MQEREALYDNRNTKPTDLSNISNHGALTVLFILSSNYQPVAEFIFGRGYFTVYSDFDSSVQDLQYLQLSSVLYILRLLRIRSCYCNRRFYSTYRLTDRGGTIEGL